MPRAPLSCSHPSRTHARTYALTHSEWATGALAASIASEAPTPSMTTKPSSSVSRAASPSPYGPSLSSFHEDCRTRQGLNSFLGSLSLQAFTKPICEVMLNQDFFNGMANERARESWCVLTLILSPRHRQLSSR